MSAAPPDLCRQVVETMLIEPWPGMDIGMWPAALEGRPYSDATADPIALLPLAARGDVGAQRELALQALYAALGDLGDDPVVMISEGLMFARMAASHGEPDDMMLVITMLSLVATLSSGPVAADFTAECIARLSGLADQDGDVGEQASRLLVQSADHETPEIFELAKAYRARIAAAQEDK